MEGGQVITPLLLEPVQYEQEVSSWYELLYVLYVGPG
jgi:hypothetical protein